MKAELGNPLLLHMRHGNSVNVSTQMLTWLTNSSSIVFWLVGDEVEQIHSESKSRVLPSGGLNNEDSLKSILESRKGVAATAYSKTPESRTRRLVTKLN